MGRGASVAFLPDSFTMTSLLRSRELYLLLLFIPAAFCTTRSAVAQRAPVGQPVISRMCLWNAGKAVWRALDLHRDQVRHLNVIRQRYPAVVQGQWVSGSDSADVDLHYAGRLNRIQAHHFQRKACVRELLARTAATRTNLRYAWSASVCRRNCAKC